MTKTDHSPIIDAELDHLFAPLLPHAKIAVGVSGGSDSTALMHLLVRWFELNSKKIGNLLVLTVDHGLRPESVQEAEQVARQAAQLRLRHQILEWQGDKPSTGVQAAAREARYDLMILEAKANGCSALAIAHSLDDQAETLLMRLARGSGLDGLAGMAVVCECDGVALVRPLLGLPKSRLTATLRALGVDWVEDPSNEDLAYERIRVRKALGSLASLGIDPAGLGRSARRLARARTALEDTAHAALSRMVESHGGAMAVIDRTEFFALSEEIRLRLLGQIISAFGGRRVLPQMGKLEKTLEQLDRADEDGSSYSTSLGGTLVQMNRSGLIVFREPLRGDIDEIALIPGQTVKWDGRFLVTLDKEAQTGLRLSALGRPGIEELGELGGLELKLPETALLALPALRQDGRLVFVPHLDYMANKSIGANGVASGAVHIDFLAKAMFKR